jgi:transposase-like protein
MVSAQNKPSRADAEKAFTRFLAKYRAKYDKAADCLSKDREALLVFYDFPGQSIGSTSARAIPSRARSRPSAIALRAAKVAFRTTPA